MVALTCPRCRKGKLFKTKSAYRRDMTDMNKRCAHCDESFVREPGYYFGAAYMSYALAVALWVAVFVALITFDAIGWMEFSFFNDAIFFLIVGSVSLIVLMPPIYRLSRSMWIHTFVKYRTDAVEFNLAKKKKRELGIVDEVAIDNLA